MMNTDKIREMIPVDVIEDIKDVSGYLWERGWAERNAGNFSMRLNLTALANAPLAGYKRENFKLTGLKNTCILISKSGARMRDMKNNPFEHLILLAFSDEPGKCSVIDLGRSKNSLPTSELITHLVIQNMMIENGLNEKCLLHCHHTELIALTQIKEYTGEKALNQLLWNMHPEAMLFIPEGIGLVPFVIPGNDKIALASKDKFKDHKIICWEKHGALAMGKTLSEAFDLFDIAAKSVNIFFKVKNAGYRPEGLSEKDLNKIRNMTD